MPKIAGRMNLYKNVRRDEIIRGIVEAFGKIITSGNEVVCNDAADFDRMARQERRLKP
jgi:hypothetical protein